MTVGSNRFEYDGYQNHWHTNVGATGYKEKWASNVIADLQSNSVWDGVFVDNQLAEITAYTPGSVFPDQYATMPDGHAAYTNFINYTASQIEAQGYGVMANMANARLYTGLWDNYTAQQSSGFDEFWTTFGGTSTTANNLGEYDEGWGRQMAEVDSMSAAGKMGVFSAQTSGGVCTKCAVYGYASYLLANNGRQAFLESNVDNDGANYLPDRAMYSWKLGAAVGARTEIMGTDSNLFQRKFQSGMALVNADYSVSRTVTLDEAYRNEDGQEVTSVTLEPLSATILRLVNTTPPADQGGGSPTPPASGSGSPANSERDTPISLVEGFSAANSDPVLRAPNTGFKAIDSAPYVLFVALAFGGLGWAARRYGAKMLK